MIEENGEPVASMPYVSRRELGFTVLKHPPLTQTLGPWVRPSRAKTAKRLSREKELLTALIDRLPPFDHFSQNWHYTQTNWLPFYWRGFRQTTRYTYVLPELADEATLWDELGTNIRGDIRKATNRFGLRVRDDLGLDAFLALNRKVFERQGRPVPFGEDVVRRLHDACRQRNACRILVAEDAEGRRHAGVYLVWDTNSAYYLMGGSDPELRSSGASSLCLWHAIKYAATVTRRFDFEGSMIEPIERYFRAFGARQVPYFAISRTASRLFTAVTILRSIARRA